MAKIGLNNMTWFTASVLTAIRTLDEIQESIPIFEDFFLIEANNREDAQQEAERIGQEQADIDDELTLYGKPARRIFLGIKKVRSIYNPPPFDIDSDRPVNGTELTHSYFEVATFDEAERLAKGTPVKVLYIDDSV
jgi:hypothetical protein